jgi:hypothetical protein
MGIKYRVKVEPKNGTMYNPMHDELQGSIATDLSFHIGCRGYFLAELSDGRSGGISTSPIGDIVEFENGDIRLSTLNTVYTFNKII